MDVLELTLRSATSGLYAPYSFTGDGWTPETRAVVEAAIKPHVPEAVDSMFNNWGFDAGMIGHKVFYIYRRATWDRVRCAYTADEIASQITAYYNRR